MVAELVVVVDEARQAVGWIDLPGQLAGGIPDQVLVERLRAVRIEGARLEAIDAEPPPAARRTTACRATIGPPTPALTS